jgi:AcrR family transcriptional regulator
MNSNLHGMEDPHAVEANRILDVALELAHERGNWYDLGFGDLAARCELSVNEIRRHYADTNAIANAWFARALEAMLANDDDTDALPVKVRLEVIMQRWFDSLAQFHQVTAQMLGSKLHAPHIQHWVPMIFDLSRLIQFWRDAAGLRAGGRRRQVEEIVLTGIFLATLSEWCGDRTPGQTEARSRLRNLLGKAERSAGFWPGSNKL